MHNLDRALADHAFELRPDCWIERMPLPHFDEVYVEIGCRAIDRIGAIARVANVTDGDGEAGAIRECSAVQNRFFGSATGTADTSKLEYANWMCHSEGRP